MLLIYNSQMTQLYKHIVLRLVVVDYVKKIVMYMHRLCYLIVHSQNRKYVVIKYIYQKFMKKNM